ncbi:MAG: hypothetical protein AAFR55_04870 [Pseudomonadota bacterium]
MAGTPSPRASVPSVPLGESGQLDYMADILREARATLDRVSDAQERATRQVGAADYLVQSMHREFAGLIPAAQARSPRPVRHLRAAAPVRVALAA